MKGAMRTVLLLFGLALCASGHAQYPSKTIRWVVPYTPAGITDTVTRVVMQKLEASLGQLAC